MFMESTYMTWGCNFVSATKENVSVIITELN